MRALVVLLVAITLHAESIEERLRRAQDLMAHKQKALAQGTLEGAAQLCESASDAACPEVYDWLGMLLESEFHGDLAILADRAEPLYAKALSRSGPNPPALSLELEASALKRLGQLDRAAALTDQALALRIKSVAAMSTPSPSTVGQAPAVKSTPPIQPPRLVSRTEPEFTDPARLLQVQGTVLLSTIVDTDGQIRQVELKRSVGFGLDEQAARAVQAWKLTPAVKDGQPVRAIAQIEVTFRLL